MLFKPTHFYIKTSDLKVTMNSENIELVDQFKFLGMWIDRHLTWEYHLNCLENKISQYQYLLKSCINLVPKKTLLLLYYSYIYSNLLYDILLWGTMCSKKISKNHDQIVNLISCGNMSPYEDLNVLKLRDVVSLEMNKLMYNFKQKTLPSALYQTLNEISKTHGYETRNANIPNIPVHSSSLYNRSFLVESTMEWLFLKSSIKNCNSIKQMANEYKKTYNICLLNISC